MKDAIEVSMVFHEGNRMMAVPKQPAPVQDASKQFHEWAVAEQAAQPAPVQEPVAWQVHPFDYGIGHEGVYARTDRPEQVEMWKRKGWTVQPLYTTSQTQPAVPDALNPKDENPAYAAGWNDCRAEMLKGMKP